MDVRYGFGIAALAFLAGFVAERTVLKVDEVSKTLFSAIATTGSISILEPAQGQNVGGHTSVHVAVDVPGLPGYITATCLEEPAPPVPLERQHGRIWAGDVTLGGAPGTKTICVMVAVGDQPMKEQVTISA